MIVAGSIGYAATGVFYLLLAILLATTWRGHRIGAYLIAAAVISVVWGLFLAYQLAYGSAGNTVVMFLDAVRLSAWIFFLAVLVNRIGASRALVIFAVLAPLAIVAWAGIGAVVAPASWPVAAAFSKMFLPAGLSLSLLGLVLIAHLYHRSSPESRWSLKPLVLGLGGVFAYDLFLFSQGILLGTVDTMTWISRGFVNLVFVPMIAIAARRHADWEVQIFVSRHVVFYAATVIAVGLYLLLVSLGGYLLVLHGGSWGGLARIVFFAGAVLVLIALLSSTTLLPRLRVFLNKHFFQSRYDYREEWLRLVATLSDFDMKTAREVLVKAMAQIVRSPSGAMWSRIDASSDFRPTASFQTTSDFPEIGRDEPVVKFIQKRGWIVDFTEYQRDPKNYGRLDLPGWLAGRQSAWLLVPVLLRKELLGLVLLDKAPGSATLNYEDRDLLNVVASHIAVHLAQARADLLLAEAQQFEAYNRLTAFLMHDLSNLVAQQSLIVENAKKHKHNPEFIDDAISTIAGSVARMKRVIRQLKRGGDQGSAKWTELRFVVSTAVDRCSAKKPLPSLTLQDIDVGVRADAEEFATILAHLIGNAQDACADDGSVNVSVHLSDGYANVEIADNGEGMSQEFIRDRLFRPFDTTKGSQGMGIGAYQAREFARRMGGDLKVTSRVGQGTRLIMQVPIAAHVA